MTEDVVEMKEIWGGKMKGHLETVTRLKKKGEDLVMTERVGEMRVEIMKKIAEEDILEVLEMTTGGGGEYECSLAWIISLTAAVVVTDVLKNK